MTLADGCGDPRHFSRDETMDAEKIPQAADLPAAPAGSSPLPSDRPSPVRVPSNGAPGWLVALIGVGSLMALIAVGVLGRGDDQPPASRPGVAGAAPTATATSRPTPAVEWIRDQPPEGEPCTEVLPTGGSPLPDVAGALPGDDGAGPLPLGAIDFLPNGDRLDFLHEFEGGCFRDAVWIDPLNPTMGSGVWTAGRPFHVREGFINNDPAPLGEGFAVVLYVARLGDGDGRTYRYTADYVLRGASDRCGPTYRTQSATETCEWFVHDFPDGLPEGRFAIWAVWEAPCRAWVELGMADSCADPDAAISLFASGFDAPYDHPY